jgi:hypothetical protein
MPETKAISYTFKELAGVLVKERGIHEGYWGVSLDFALAAGLVPFPPTDVNSLMPAAIVPVTRIGLHRFDTPNSLTVDAAEVNPISADNSTTEPPASTPLPPRKKRSVTKSE